eukprot:TRINITY_DN10208_c0_g2_i1.p1 TRINITY_DN10208_c0_g2~~TRINITY_DN10208_c0_g2_i1.p1  ORF type:complete len:1232 (-),score=244.60 TRINITY_DN10208_c0_g2_i1:198-3893(-)
MAVKSIGYVALGSVGTVLLDRGWNIVNQQDVFGQSFGDLAAQHGLEASVAEQQRDHREEPAGPHVQARWWAAGLGVAALSYAAHRSRGGLGARCAALRPSPLDGRHGPAERSSGSSRSSSCSASAGASQAAEASRSSPTVSSSPAAASGVVASSTTPPGSGSSPGVAAVQPASPPAAAGKAPGKGSAKGPMLPPGKGKGGPKGVPALPRLPEPGQGASPTGKGADCKGKAGPPGPPPPATSPSLGGKGKSPPGKGKGKAPLSPSPPSQSRMPGGKDDSVNIAAGAFGKKMHWTTLPSSEGTVFKFIEEKSERVKTREVEEPESSHGLKFQVLEEAFKPSAVDTVQKQVSRSQLSRTSGKRHSIKRAAGVELIMDSKRVQNLALKFRQTPISITTLQKGLMKLDFRLDLPEEDIERWIELWPSDQERRLVLGYEGPPEDLRDVEQNLRRLASIPRGATRLNFMRLAKDLEILQSSCHVHLQRVQLACKEMLTSQRWRVLFAEGLRIGNWINHGPESEGGARAIPLVALMQLRAFKGFRGATALHCLCIYCAMADLSAMERLGDEAPAATDFFEALQAELKTVQLAAGGADLETIQELIARLRKNVTLVFKELEEHSDKYDEENQSSSEDEAQPSPSEPQTPFQSLMAAAGGQSPRCLFPPQDSAQASPAPMSPNGRGETGSPRHFAFSRAVTAPAAPGHGSTSVPTLNLQGLKQTPTVNMEDNDAKTERAETEGDIIAGLTIPSARKLRMLMEGGRNRSHTLERLADALEPPSAAWSAETDAAADAEQPDSTAPHAPRGIPPEFAARLAATPQSPRDGVLLSARWGTPREIRKRLGLLSARSESRSGSGRDLLLGGAAPNSARGLGYYDLSGGRSSRSRHDVHFVHTPRAVLEEAGLTPRASAGLTPRSTATLTPRTQSSLRTAAQVPSGSCHAVPEDAAINASVAKDMELRSRTGTDSSTGSPQGLESRRALTPWLIGLPATTPRGIPSATESMTTSSTPRSAGDASGASVTNASDVDSDDEDILPPVMQIFRCNGRAPFLAEKTAGDTDVCAEGEGVQNGSCGAIVMRSISSTVPGNCSAAVLPPCPTRSTTTIGTSKTGLTEIDGIKQRKTPRHRLEALAMRAVVILRDAEEDLADCMNSATECAKFFGGARAGSKTATQLFTSTNEFLAEFKAVWQEVHRDQRWTPFLNKRSGDQNGQSGSQTPGPLRRTPPSSGRRMSFGRLSVPMT